MIPALRSELRKLLTVRSTYVISVLVLVIVALFAGFGDGFRGSQPSLKDPGLLNHEAFVAIVFVGLVFGLVGLLLFGHEYRYNTILYTLTSSRSRLRSLVAKAVITTGYAVVMSVIVAFFSPLATIVGAHLAGKTIGYQSFDVWQVLWRCIFVGWGYSMYAFVSVGIIRSQVGSIVTFLMVPLIGENIIQAIFKSSAKYLPFNSLQSVAVRVTAPGSIRHAVVVSLCYIVGGVLISAVLFLRRDAASS